MMHGVPRFHRWLLARSAPGEDRTELIADLDDEMRRRAEDDGVAAARRWYRRQARRSILPMVRRRLALRAARSRRAASGRRMALGIGQDLRVAVRALGAAPVFAVSTVLLLGVGVGAFTVIYAFVDAQTVRALPYGDRNDRLVTVHSVHPTLTDAADLDDAAMSYPDLIDLREASTAFEALEAALGRSVAVSAGDDTQRVLAASVTPGLFRMLGVAPMLGRVFADADAAEPGFEPVVIVSHALWRDLLGADPQIVGRTLRLNDRAVVVTGVMPPGFRFPDEHQLWLPYRAARAAGRENRSWLAIGLLRPGVSADEGLVEARGIVARLAETHPATNRDWGVVLLPIRRMFVGSVSDESVLLAAVSLLLLAACANLAGLMVARGVSRRGELTVRAALGGRRLRLIRWLAAEAVVLAVCGGLLGLLLASWGITALVAWIPEPPAYWAMPRLDIRVAAAAIGVTVLVACLAGVMPAFRLSSVRAADALVTGVRSAGAPGHRRLQHVLVAGQVSLCFALVMGAQLISRSATALLEADAGFDHRPLLSARVYMAGDQYDPIEARAAQVRDIIDRISRVPGVSGVAATGAIPSDDGGADILLLPDGIAQAGDGVGAQLVPVTPEFWDALNLALLDGRTFTTSEADDPTADTLIVNRRLAERFWPRESAVGRTLRVMSAGTPVSMRVIGVAPDLVYEEFTEETPQSQLNVYVPYARAGWRSEAVLVRAATPIAPGALADAVRDAIRAAGPGVAVYDVQTMVDRRQYNHWGDEFIGRTMTAFALAALLIACIGTYGITSHGVATRRREIGVRMAIGATTRDVLALFAGTGVRLGVIGTAVGLPLAAATARWLESDLFRVSPWDARLWIGLPVALIGSVLLASYWPARGASRLDPARTLRDG